MSTNEAGAAFTVTADVLSVIRDGQVFKKPALKKLLTAEMPAAECLLFLLSASPRLRSED